MELTLNKLRECKGALDKISDGVFFMIVHPKIYYDLKVITARVKYKHGQWVRRWERWSGQKYIEAEGEFGVLS